MGANRESDPNHERPEVAHQTFPGLRPSLWITPQVRKTAVKAPIVPIWWPLNSAVSLFFQVERTLAVLTQYGQWERKRLHFQRLESGNWLNGSSDECHGETVFWNRNNQLRSVVCAVPATVSRFARHAQLPPAALTRSWAIESCWLADGSDASDLAPALYQILQRARILGLNTVVAHIEDTDSPLARVLRLAELNAGPEKRSGTLCTASAQMLDVAIHGAARACDPSTWAQVQPGLAQEAIETVQRWVNTFYAGSWAQSIFKKTMTREQYVQSLCNMHHFVRQTTQHLGRAIAHAPNREMRRHFIDHLNGEINHEVSLENDLRHLGEDPEYVMLHRVPNAPTKAFMAIQETSIAFYTDPMLLMACPFVAEAVTGNMPKEFLTSLLELVSSWGVEKPEKATTFLLSHTHTDGGDDGHWQGTAAILNRYLVDEATQRRFLCTLRCAADCFERSFNSSIDDFVLFSRTS